MIDSHAHLDLNAFHRDRDVVLERAREAGHGVFIARVERGNEASRKLLLSKGFYSVGVMRKVGKKFGRLLDVEMFELELD